MNLTDSKKSYLVKKVSHSMAKDDKKKKTVTEYLDRHAKIIRSAELASAPKYMQDMKNFQDKLVPPHLRAMNELEERYKNTFAISSMFDGYKKFSPVMKGSFQSLEEIAKMVNAITYVEDLTVPFPDPKLLEIFNAFRYEDLNWCEYDLDDAEEEDIEPEKKAEIIHRVPALIKSIYDDQDLLNNIHPRQFEEIVAELLYNQGFEVELTKQTRDGGYDILAISSIGGSTFKTLVECKRHKKNIGVGIIREFFDVINTEKANKGVIITTSYFSKDARDRQEKEGTLLDLKDRADLIHWVNNYCRNSS